MEQFLIDEAVEIISGRIIQRGDARAFQGVSIDSRRIVPGDLFIPIVGENMDGHDYIPQAVEAGAVAVLTQKSDVKVPEKVSLIAVESTKTALQALGGANRKRYDIPVVVVTGSSGKTTTKDVIASVLSQKFVTMKTQGNLNNQLGIPQTLLQLDGHYQAAVVETGMDHLGDIRETIGTILPHFAVITNIGTAHLEFLKTRENILKAKMESLETLGASDFAILNGDDPYLNTIQSDAYQILRVGIDAPELDLRAKDIASSSEGIAFTVDGESYSFPFPGVHNVYNALCAIAIARKLGLTSQEIQDGFNAFVPSGNRMKIESIGGITYIDDSYNANPDAVKAAVNVLVDLSGRTGKRIAVLGDMLEMGETGPQLHEKIGEYAGKRVDRLITVGDLARNYAVGARKHMQGIWILSCKDAREAGKLLANLAMPGDTVLIKASHGIHLEEIMKMVKGVE